MPSNAPGTPLPVPKLADLPIGLVDEPLHPIRENMDEDGLMDLAELIHDAGGLVQPIAVQPEGDRYRVCCGHRRLLASRIAMMPTIRAMIFDPDAELGMIMMYVENQGREELNPVEEGRKFLAMLAHIDGQDIDVLAARLKLRREHIELRILVCQGDPEIRDALGRKSISLGVAEELNKYRDLALRRVRLQNAVEGGATIRAVREWRRQDKATEDAMLRQATESLAGTDQQEVVGPALPSCLICGVEAPPGNCRYVVVHIDCESVFRRQLAQKG